MPDITMCQQDDCKSAKICYRHEAKPDPFRQSFFTDDPRDPDGSCRYVWPISHTNTGGIDHGASGV